MEAMPRLGLAWLVVLSAPMLPAQQYPFVPVPGSPAGIRTIVEGTGGRLWIAAGDDVFCFDGRLFFSLRSHGLPPVQAEALAEDGKSGVWIGSQSDSRRARNMDRRTTYRLERFQVSDTRTRGRDSLRLPARLVRGFGQRGGRLASRPAGRPDPP